MINREKWESTREKRTALQNELKNAETNLYKMAQIAEQGPSVIDDIDQQFENATQLTSKDMSLLFVSIGLQITRWAIISSIQPLSLDYKSELTPRDKRMTAEEGDQFANASSETKKTNVKKQNLVNEYDIKDTNASKDYSNDGYRTVAQILFRPVPYDAISTFNDTNSPDVQAETKRLLEEVLPFKISGNSHRSLTLGHDPIWGWIFGTINILTRSITFKATAFPTFPVVEKGNKITTPQSDLISKCAAAMESIEEDNNRLAAAVVKQSLHFASDKYTKTGLPIPFLSAEQAQKLIEQNWNSAELEKWIKKASHTFAHDSGVVAMQGALSYLINEIIRIIHILLCSDEDIDNQLREVRTRRIISISNSIASSSNIIYAAVRAYVSESVLEGVKVLDIGGIVETTHRLIADISFRSEIKMEYLKNHWSNYVNKELGDTHA